MIVRNTKDKVYKVLPIDKIIPNDKQPRTVFDDEKIQELALSIQNNGLIQPIIVRKIDNKYQIVAGERRYRACILAAIKEVPCLITKYDTQQVDTLAIIENIQREDLSVIEEAKAYKTLMDTYGYTQSELAQKVGKKQSTIANKLRLLKLSNDVKVALDSKEITERHARAMLGLEEEKQHHVLHEVLKKSLTVQQTESLINKKEKPKPTKKSISRNVKIAVNTINQATKMIVQSGVDVEQEYIDKEDEYIITLKIKK